MFVSIRHAIVVTAAVSVFTGCLSQSHTIPRRDLQALAQTDPNQRSQRVRVIQNFVTQEEPPEAPAVRGSTVVVVHSAVPVPGPRTGPVRVGSGGGSKASKLAEQEADHAAVYVALAVVAALGLAVTEGARYDGWVQVHPMHPVHLYGWDGGYTWVPMAQLTPELAAWTRKAVIRQAEGPWQPMGRAPLNRRGLAYSVFLGTTEVPLADGDETRGFMSHIQFGGFFTQEVGLMLDIGMGWGDNAEGDVVFDLRNALELQVMPVALGKLHAGLFGQIGAGTRLDDSDEGDDSFDVFFGGGGLLQLDITTRLALTARAGVTQIYGETISDLTAGLSIY